MARRTAATKAAPTEAPAAKTPAAKKTTPVANGTAWLVQHVNELTGKTYTGYQLRILIRKLVKDGTLDRGEGRYEFTGPRDPQVLAIVKAVKAGGVKDAQTERVAKAKAEPAAKSEPAAKTTRSRRKPAAAPAEEDDLELDEL